MLDFAVRVYDNAGNLVTRFGHYGNADVLNHRIVRVDPTCRSEVILELK